MLPSKSPQLAPEWSLPSEVWSEVYGYLPNTDVSSTSVVSQSTAKGLKEYAAAHQWSLDTPQPYYCEIWLSSVVLKLLDKMTRNSRRIVSPDQQSMQLAAAIYAIERTTALGGTCAIITSHTVDSMRNTIDRIYCVNDTRIIIVTPGQRGLKFTEDVHTVIILGNNPFPSTTEAQVVAILMTERPIPEVVLEDEQSPMYYLYYEYEHESKLIPTIKQAILECSGRVLVIAHRHFPIPSDLHADVVVWQYKEDYIDEYEHMKYFDSYILLSVSESIVRRFASICWRSHSIKKTIVINKRMFSTPIPIPAHISIEFLNDPDDQRLEMIFYEPRRVKSVCGLSYAELTVVSPYTTEYATYINTLWATNVLGRDLLVRETRGSNLRRIDGNTEMCWLKLDPNEEAYDVPIVFSVSSVSDEPQSPSNFDDEYDETFATGEIVAKLRNTTRGIRSGRNSYTTDQLRIMLDARGLKTTGSRVELANRLLADL